MREIKFRIWDKANEIIIQDDGHFYITADGDVIGVNDDLDISESVILMQYTGLHDKNGKEIYEGDIVTGKRDSHWHGGYDRVRGTAYFSDSHLAFRVDGSGGGWLHNVEKMEVIGNIYENPELLEEVQ
ncbi:YopX family protein [Brevibacillus laterosporus]|uniref:YopX family protein n=1 Tax=Brevibacillus laterosporus TaxID=1465 RepID=UPI00195DEE43|nr:YopX family protein [Brevibacillus laterosporus]MBM7108389.1 YopX protein [Brevibacillus laterosporus]